MALVFEQEQWTFVGHRMNFVGRPSSFNTTSWDYEGRTMLVTRPDDGNPAANWSVHCPVCSKTLNYTVHSVAAARGRRTRRWVWAWSSYGIVAIALLSLVITGGDDVALGIALVAAFLGFFIGYLSAYVAARETGFVGHGASWPVIPKHAVKLPEPGPPGQS